MSSAASPVTWPREHYLNTAFGFRSWLLARDHKRVALLHLLSAGVFGVLGGALALLMPLELITPQADLFAAETYHQLLVSHGIVMIFLFLLPSIFAGVGSFLIPLMIGARGLVYPCLHLAGWYVFLLGGALTLRALVTGDADQSFAPGLALMLCSSFVTALNLVLTIQRRRAPGLTWSCLPLFVWTQLVAGLLVLIAFPVLLLALTPLAFGRLSWLAGLMPALSADPPQLNQWLDWCARPAAYIALLPAVGIVSELIPCFSRRTTLSHAWTVCPTASFALLGLLVWAGHLCLNPQPVWAETFLPLLSLLLFVPAAVLLFQWTATLWRASLSYATPMLYAFGFIGLSTVGAASGLFLATPGMNVHLADTCFEDAHFHYLIAGAVLMAFLGGLHYWWPKITGRLYPEGWGRLSSLVIFLGANLTFFPRLLLGYLGLPRRYYAYPEEFQLLSAASSGGALLLAAGWLLALVCLAWSMRYGRPAGPDPWGAAGLEWRLSSPPPSENFERMPNAAVWSKLLFCILVAASPFFSQVTTGSISGYVFDPSGGPVPNADVMAADKQHSVLRRMTADASGFYRFVGLAPAAYTVSAYADRFDQAMAPEIVLGVNTHVRADLHLSLSGLRQSLDITASVRSLQTESSEAGAVLSRETIDKLPLNRRDFLQLALLAPGVMPPAEESELSTHGSFAMHANGGREEYNNYLLDGVDNNDPYGNTYELHPSADAIQEFKIATSTYGAEYGRSAAGQVNVITRGGTNEFHGSIYEYLRNRTLDARNFFDRSDKPQFVRNQFGVAFGGPLVRHRSFFFGNADFLRERRGLSRLASVPTEAERRGDLSGLGRAVIDPFTGQPFPGNAIPRDLVSPTARRILDLFPLPSLPGSSGNYLAQPISREGLSQSTVRGDQRLGKTDQLTVRYAYGLRNLFVPYEEDTDAAPGFGNFVTGAAHNATIHHQWVLGPRTVNSLRLGFGRISREILPQNHRVDVAGLWGVAWIDVPSRDYGYPLFDIAGYSQVGDTTFLPTFRYTDSYEIRNGLSVVRGAHFFKAGGELRHVRLNGRLDMLTRGSLSFSGAFTGAGVGDLLLGLVSFGMQAQADNPMALRTTAYNAYFQDDWKVRPDLAVNLGLRYEYNTPPVDPANRMSLLDFQTRRLVLAGTAGTSRSGVRPDRNNVAPRIGFAWSPARDLVVRGGYGLYYDSGMMVVNSAQYFNPPQFNLRVFFPTAESLLTLEDPFPSEGGTPPPPSLNLLSPDLTSAYMQHWSFGIQRPLGSLGILSWAYLGSKGTHLIRSRDLNQPRPGPGEIQVRRPMHAYGATFFAESEANSSFQSLQGVFERPVSRTLSLRAVYTFSKSIDDSSAFLDSKADQNFPQDSQNYRAERAVSSFDIRHRAALAYVYALPQSHWATRNMDCSGIVTLQSGQPFTPILRFDNSNTGNTGGTFGSDRPDLLGDPRLAHPTAERWFDAGAFGIPSRFSFGSAGRNIVRGDGLLSLDVSLARRFGLERWGTLEFAVQAFNLLNHANFDLPELFADEPATFGKVFSGKASRQVQLALRLRF